MDFAVVDVEDSHKAYFREQFALHADGGRLLGRFLGELDLDRGRMWGVVPAERALDAAADLEPERAPGETTVLQASQSRT